jgi:SAM-dependent methyltransferase
MNDVRDHWDEIYGSKSATEVSWFQAQPTISLELIETYAPDRSSGIIDIGSGQSRLIAALLAKGYADVTVLDVSAVAIAKAKSQLGPPAEDVSWIDADITDWTPSRQWDLWHDRAVFHFLIEPAAQQAYIAAMSAALPRGAHAIMATFGLDGPERCSGLAVQRYSGATLLERMGEGYRLVDEVNERHVTPRGVEQRFTYSVLERQ